MTDTDSDIARLAKRIYSRAKVFAATSGLTDLNRDAPEFVAACRAEVADFPLFSEGRFQTALRVGVSDASR